jgi:purine-binding chemotaxis protein CheW
MNLNMSNMENVTYLTFVLDNDLFAVDVKSVLEVLEQQHITKVPKAPEGILGIINFRGEILPVIDSRKRFNLPARSENEKVFVIILEVELNDRRHLISATADGVRDVIEVAQEEVKPVPELGLSYDARFISGVIQLNEHFVLVVKPSKLFSIADLKSVVE